MVKNTSANSGDIRDMGLIHGSGRSPGGGYGNQFQFSCLENPVNRGAYSPWGHKELGMTEATMHVSMHRPSSWCC